MNIDQLKRLLSSYYLWVLVCFLVSLSFVSVARFSHPEKKHNVVISDAKGYYAYFAGLFIYQDLNFKFNGPIEHDKHPETRFVDYRYKLNKQKIFTKYYVGTAIAYTPVLLVAHGVSLAAGWDSDGYTAWYHSAVVIASLLYLLIAMLFMGKVLDYFRVKKWAKILTVFGVFFGTNWFYYTTWESGMSHSYSAAVFSVFLYFFIRFKTQGGPRGAAVLGFLLGFIVLLRPSNLFILAFLPLFFTTWSNFIHFLQKKILTVSILSAGLGAFLAVVSIQFIIYKIQLDQWYVYGYIGEGFNLTKPHLIDFFFSIRKGFFVYTPMMVFALIGLVFWYRDRPFRAIWWIGAMLVHMYILSTWHMWWYGGTLGTRVMVEYYIFWMIPIGVFFSNARRSQLYGAVPIFLFLTLYGHLQQYQYRLGLLHWDSMTWELYKNVFFFPIIPWDTF